MFLCPHAWSSYEDAPSYMQHSHRNGTGGKKVDHTGVSMASCHGNVNCRVHVFTNTHWPTFDAIRFLAAPASVVFVVVSIIRSFEEVEGLPSHSFDDILGSFNKLLLVLLSGGYRDIFQGEPEARRSQFGIHWLVGRKESAQPPELGFTRGRGGYKEVR